MCHAQQDGPSSQSSRNPGPGGYPPYVAEPSGETQETYDLIAGTYARQNSTVYPRLRTDVELLRVELPSGSVIADVGCGRGRELGFLRENGYRAVGLDLSLETNRTILDIGGRHSYARVAEAEYRALGAELFPTLGFDATSLQEAR